MMRKESGYGYEDTRSNYNRGIPKPTIGRTSMLSSNKSTTATGAQKSATAATFRKGQKVLHKVWGAGIIQEVTPMGGDMLLQIEFDTVGNKLMMAKTAGQFIKAI